MNANDNLYLLYMHMNGVNPEYIQNHAIVAGKLANGEIKNIEEYIKECSKQGISCYSGGYIAKRFFNYKKIYNKEYIKTMSDYDCFCAECDKFDVRIIYSESTFKYVKNS